MGRSSAVTCSSWLSVFSFFAIGLVFPLFHTIVILSHNLHSEGSV